MRNGNYEPLQCDSGVCWCAEEQTGRIVNGTRPVPENLWTKLPCCKCKLKGIEIFQRSELKFNFLLFLRRR